MSGSQKFIARNRAPRVQIEYDVELYGAEKKVQLPFVMGVMSDLSGKAEKPPIGDRAFLEIDVDNFDDRMKAMAPKAQFSVPNTLTGEGNLAIDLTFEKISDFSPTAVAEKVDSLRPLLEARKQLSDLMTYMDGKSGAEALIENLLQQPALLSALSGQGEGHADVDSALDSLRAVPVPDDSTQDDATDTLNALRAKAPDDAPEDTSVSDALSTLTPPPQTAPDSEDEASAVLAGLERVEDTPQADQTADVLASIEAIDTQPEVDATDDILAGVEAADTPEEADTTQDVLSSIEHVETVEETDVTSDVLAGIEAVEVIEHPDQTSDVLAGIEQIEAEVEEDTTGDVLASVEAVTTPEDIDQTDDVLAAIEPTDVAEAVDETANVLGAIEAVEAPVEEDATADVLASLEQVDVANDPETDAAADILAGIEAVEGVEEEDISASILAELEPVIVAEAVDETADILGAIEQTEAVVVEEDVTSDVLAGIEPAAVAEAVDMTADVLAGVEAVVPDDVAEDTAEDILAVLEAVEVDSRTPQTADILSTVAPIEPVDVSDDVADALASVDPIVPPQAVPDQTDDILSSIEAEPPVASEPDDDLDALLADISNSAPVEAETDATDDLDALLSDLSADAPEDPVPSDSDELDALLSDLGSAVLDDSPEQAEDDLDALLSDLARDVPEQAGVDDTATALQSRAVDEVPDAEDAADDLDSLLADLSGSAPEVSEEPVDDLDALLADLNTDTPAQSAPVAQAPEDDLDALLADLETPEPAPVVSAPEDDLDALLADLEPTPQESPPEMDDLDALLADLEPEVAAAPDAAAASDDLDALLADLDSDSIASVAPEDDLDALLADINTEEAPVAPTKPAQNPFGTMSAARPARETLHRDRFRMALFGDFTGRSAKGLMETGDALAARTPIELDVDTVEDVIEGFGTTLTLPIGKDGAGIDVPLKELDDLHPDELFDNVELFDALSGLKQQLGIGSMADKARQQLKGWSESYGTPIRLPKRSSATSVPPDKKLSDFQALIGDTAGTLTQASPIDEMLARIVGPHIVKTPDADAKAMQAAVDDALSSAMRLILHHPDFQAVESQWRSLDMLARRVETDVKLQIVLYDVSAEEMAADLAGHEDLAQSGLFRLLTDVLDPETGDGGFSALFGLYTFEETPPHAELLARVSTLAAHVDAPFFAAMTPGYLATEKEDRHPLVARAWDALRALPEAAYLGLASPRFLLRQPYGAKSDPIDPFEFEEFTPQEGLSGMLWANPVVLVAILLAGTYKKDGKAMNLGSMMSLGDMPFHYVKDRFGDQVGLPCTERNLTSAPAQATLGRGFMPVLWVKGRNEIRLGSFRSVGGEEISGSWSGAVPRAAAPSGQATLEVEFPAGGNAGGEDESLDDLLAAFDDTGADDADLEEMDPELAALLEGL